MMIDKDSQLSQINELISQTLEEMSSKYETKVRQLSLLSKLSRSFAERPSPENYMKNLLNVFFSEFISAYCAVLFSDADRKKMYPIAYKTAQEDSDEVTFCINDKSLFCLDHTDGGMYKCLQVGEVYYSSDAQAETKKLAEIFNTPVPHSLIRIPLKIGDKTFGLVEITHMDENYFDEDHVRLFMIVGNFLSLLLLPFYNKWYSDRQQ